MVPNMYITRTIEAVIIKLTANPTGSMIKHFNVIQNPGKGALICLREEDMPLTENVNVIPVSYI